MSIYKVRVGLFDLKGDAAAPFDAVEVELVCSCRMAVRSRAERMAVEMFPHHSHVLFEAIGEPVSVAAA